MKTKYCGEKKAVSFPQALGGNLLNGCPTKVPLFGIPFKAESLESGKFGHNGFIGVFVVVILTMFVVVQPATAQLNSKQVFAQVKFEQKLNSQIPLDATFRDETGKEVKLAEYFHDKPVVLSLVYYECPMLCTQVLNGMDQAFNSLRMSVGKDFNVVTVSINPKETPDIAAGKKKEYLKMYGNRPGSEEGWHFLTGEKPQIDSLADAVGFRYLYDSTTDTYAHPSGIMVLTPQGKVSRYLFGIEYQPRDLRFSLIEASSRKIGSPVDQLLLLCYCYNPVTGKYGLVIQNIFRAAGAVTIVVLGTVLFIFFRHEKKKNGAQDAQEKT
ncbi:MAG: SCO family protein [Bacteroidota bacterium]|nr:SCO family protein [Bacteroidota bacterium]